MGEVYLARHEALNKRCAVKVIPPDQVTEIGWQRFQIEAKAVGKLDHVNLIRVTDLGIHDGCLPFYAMDYVEGQNLAEIIAERKTLQLKEVLELFMQVCDGVECAHRAGILHRDLKPANIMIAVDKSGNINVKVLDFGLAKLTAHDRNKQSLTAVGDIFGSPFYMSPEQCMGEKLDHLSDIYAIGCTMFECLTGRPPFVSTIASAVMFSHQEADPPTLASVAGQGKFPPAMEIVIAKALRKIPNERYQTFSQLKSDLADVAAGRDVLPVYAGRDKKAAARVAESEPIEQTRSGSLRTPIIAGAVLLVLTLAGALFSISPPGTINKHAQTAVPSAPKPTSTLAVEYSGMDQEFGSLNFDSVAGEDATGIVLPKTDYFSKTIIQDGKQFTQFDFPKLKRAQSLGWLSQAAGYQTRIEGTNIFPKAARLTLIPAPLAAKVPHFFEMFRPGDIHTVYFPSLSTEAIVISAAKTRGVKIVSLRGCAFSKAVDPALEELAPDTLIVTHCLLDWSDLARLNFLPAIHHLEITQGTNIAPALRRISGSKNLQRLKVAECKLSLTDLTWLSNCPNLTAVNIDNNKITIEGLQQLEKLPKLTELSATGTGLKNSTLINALSKFPSLRVLDIAPSSMTAQDLRLLSQKCPKLRVQYLAPDE
jgi:serine/threonine protein kinase